MSIRRWIFIGVTLLSGACGGKFQPTLELDGHWVVDHGFDDDCKVTVSFYDNQMMALSFYSLAEGACQPERYGIRGDAVLIDIASKKDYVDGDGALATELQILVHDLWLRKTLRLTETASGLRAVIVSSEDNEMELLKPLLNQNFTLAAVPTDWFLQLRGEWDAGCDPVKLSGSCEILEFRSDVIGQHRMYEKCNEELECDIHRHTTDFLYGLRHREVLSDGTYKIDIVIFGPGSGDRPAGQSLSMIVSAESIEMEGFETLTRPKKLPVVR